MRAARIAALFMSLFMSLLFILPLKAADRSAKDAPSSGTSSKASVQRATAEMAKDPPLDLALLEKRLKQTEAIGFFTKVTLKNEVDDLLQRFRTYHAGKSDTTPAELRQPYETLILKVLTLLQEGDPTLATAIAASREAIWGILTDREKFAKL